MTGRIPYGWEDNFYGAATAGRTCHDCGTLVGAEHRQPCDFEQCPICTDQLWFCGCDEWDDLRPEPFDLPSSSAPSPRSRRHERRSREHDGPTRRSIELAAAHPDARRDREGGWVAVETHPPSTAPAKVPAKKRVPA
jgi:hypothetical protein